MKEGKRIQSNVNDDQLEIIIIVMILNTHKIKGKSKQKKKHLPTNETHKSTSCCFCCVGVF